MGFRDVGGHAAEHGGLRRAPKTFIEAIRDTLADEMRRDESVIVLGEDVGKKGGVFLATDGLWAEFGDERVIDTPMTESMIIGTRSGPPPTACGPLRRSSSPTSSTPPSTSWCPRRPGCATARTMATRCR